ncbi:MAG: DUF433 domain-containing protein [Cyanobacteria bacterium J06606_4]
MVATKDIGTLITQTTALSKGRPVIAGTRTSVKRIAVLHKQGADAKEIARRLSHLSLAQVYAALAYYHANQEEIERDLELEEAEYVRLAALESHDNPIPHQ